MKILKRIDNIPEKFYTVIFTAVIAVYYLFLIPYGFDVTDTGYHLAKQWTMFNGMWKENFDFIAGSNIMGGLWLQIYGRPSLLWSRLGFVITQTLIFLFIFKILVLYFSHRKVFAVTLTTVISLSFRQHYFTVNYDNLPLLFYLAVSYMIMKRIRGGEIKGYMFYLFGITSVFPAFCKISYTPGAFIVFLLLLSGEKCSKRAIVQFATGVLSGSFLILIFAFLTGTSGFYFEHLHDLSGGFFTSSDTGTEYARLHSLKHLTWLYRNQIIDVAIIFIRIFTAAVLLYFVTIRLKSIRFLFYLCVAASLWVIYNVIFYPSAGAGIISFSLFGYCLWILLSDDNDLRDKSGLVLMSAAVFILSFIGSDLGIYTGIRSGAGILLVSSSLLVLTGSYRYYCKFPNRRTKTVFYLIPLMLFALYYIQDEFRPYQDMEFEKLTVKFRSPQLLGIKSNKGRVEVVDSLLTYLNDIPDLKEKDIFFAKHSPMYYYLTGTRYRLDSPWDTLNRLEDIKADFERQAPEMIVLPIGSHRSYRWPNEHKGWENNGGEVKVKPYYEFYDEFIKNNNYIEVYKNSFYTVYQLKFEGGMNESSAQQY